MARQLAMTDDDGQDALMGYLHHLQRRVAKPTSREPSARSEAAMYRPLPSWTVVAANTFW